MTFRELPIGARFAFPHVSLVIWVKATETTCRRDGAYMHVDPDQPVTPIDDSE